MYKVVFVLCMSFAHTLLANPTIINSNQDHIIIQDIKVEGNYFATLLSKSLLEQIEQAKKDNDVNKVSDLYNYLGFIYNIKLRNHEKASEYLGLALEYNPKNSQAHANKGLIHFNNKQHELAIIHFSQSLTLQPDNENIILSRGWAYYLTEQYDKALEDFSHLISLDSSRYSYYDSYAVVLDVLERYEEVIDVYTTMIQLKPERLNPYRLRAWSKLQLHRYQQALEDFDLMLTIDDKNWAAYYGKGMVYTGLGQFAKAIQNYTKSIELDDDSGANYSYINYLEINLITNKPFDAQIEQAFKTKFASDKEMQMFYDLLTIFSQIDNNQPYDIALWQKRYANMEMKGWQFDELEEWIHTKSGDKQQRLEEALQVFKNHTPTQ